MAKKVVVLVTGGINSTTVLAYSRKCGHEIHALTLNGGTRYRNLDNVGPLRVSAQYGVMDHYDVDATPSLCWGTTQSSPEPGVNQRLIQLAHASSLAQAIDARLILIGTNYFNAQGIDHPSFQDVWGNTIAFGTGKAPIPVFSPLSELTLPAVIKWGHDQLGADYSRTMCCTSERTMTMRKLATHCGVCDGCIKRREAFAEAGVVDPGKYEGAQA